jgi:hypothetical protein
VRRAVRQCLARLCACASGCRAVRACATFVSGYHELAGEGHVGQLVDATEGAHHDCVDFAPPRGEMHVRPAPMPIARARYCTRAHPRDAHAALWLTAVCPRRRPRVAPRPSRRRRATGDASWRGHARVRLAASVCAGASHDREAVCPPCVERTHAHDALAIPFVRVCESIVLDERVDSDRAPILDVAVAWLLEY